VKIIAISGGGQTGTMDFLQVAEKFGAQRTLQKPFSRQELLAVVRDLTQGGDKGMHAAS
jgi:DNA-binding response OmpR family regulator